MKKPIIHVFYDKKRKENINYITLEEAKKWIPEFKKQLGEKVFGISDQSKCILCMNNLTNVEKAFNNNFIEFEKGIKFIFCGKCQAMKFRIQETIFKAKEDVIKYLCNIHMRDVVNANLIGELKKRFLSKKTNEYISEELDQFRQPATICSLAGHRFVKGICSECGKNKYEVTTGNSSQG